MYSSCHPQPVQACFTYTGIETLQFVSTPGPVNEPTASGTLFQYGPYAGVGFLAWVGTVTAPGIAWIRDIFPAYEKPENISLADN
jgi:hypothetical protein